MVNLTLGIEDTHATIICNIKDQDGAAVDLTNITDAYFVIRSGISNEQQVIMVVDDAVNGILSVKLTEGMLVNGVQQARVEINWVGGEKSVTITEFEIEGVG